MPRAGIGAMIASAYVHHGSLCCKFDEHILQNADRPGRWPREYSAHDRLSTEYHREEVYPAIALGKDLLALPAPKDRPPEDGAFVPLDVEMDGDARFATEVRQREHILECLHQGRDRLSQFWRSQF